MKGKLYADVSTHLRMNKSRSYKQSVLSDYTSLIAFCLKEGLLEGSYFNDDNSLKEDTIIYESDLTERGNPIFYKLMIKWFTYTDRTKKYDNEAMLYKYLTQLEK